MKGNQGEIMLVQKPPQYHQQSRTFFPEKLTHTLGVTVAICCGS